MKRSLINRRIDAAIARFHAAGWRLPAFGYFSPAEWAEKYAQYAPARQSMLGWDLTDFGSGDFAHTGLLLFTLRNGETQLGAQGKPYAEKLMLVGQKQITPCHFHWTKKEDIICREGTLKLRFYASDENENATRGDISLLCDGQMLTLPAGGEITLTSGMSVTIPRRVYHAFWAENGDAVVGEVSQVNDDKADNRFLQPAGRFPAIEEDEPRRYVLCSEYDQLPGV